MTLARIGFTGTRNADAITIAQKNWLQEFLGEVEEKYEVHHGGCTGGDELCHWLALGYDHEVVVHPPTNERFVMKKSTWDRPNVTVLQAYPYLERDRHIVDACAALLALPDGPYRAGSGTWYTIGQAIAAKKTVAICHPDGALEFPGSNIAGVV